LLLLVLMAGHNPSDELHLNPTAAFAGQQQQPLLLLLLLLLLLPQKPPGVCL
jgi:hypothetical protein